MEQNGFEELKRLMAVGGIDASDLEKRCEVVEGIDDAEAMARLRQRIAAEAGRQPATVRQVHTWYRWAAAAAVAVLMAAGGYVWFQHESGVTPPVVSEAVQTAMLQSEKAGRQQAEIAAAAPQSLQARQQMARTLRQTYRIAGDETVEQLLEARRITTYQDKEYWLTLDDGTLVHLNYNTRLVCPERFIDGTRDVILDGEAYFMVAHDSRHPFVVHTPQGDIRVYGTEFNVSTRDGDCTEVVLVKGSVGVTPAGGTEQMMQPGQKCSMLNAQYTIDEVDVNPYVAWNTGKFSFHDEPLWKILSVIDRWYGYKTEYASPELKDITLSGNFDRYDDVRPTLEALETVTGLSFIMRDRTIIIHQ